MTVSYSALLRWSGVGEGASQMAGLGQSSNLGTESGLVRYCRITMPLLRRSRNKNWANRGEFGRLLSEHPAACFQRLSWCHDCDSSPSVRGGGPVQWEDVSFGSSSARHERSGCSESFSESAIPFAESGDAGLRRPPRYGQGPRGSDLDVWVGGTTVGHLTTQERIDLQRRTSATIEVVRANPTLSAAPVDDRARRHRWTFWSSVCQ